MHIYRFSRGAADGHAAMRDLLGGKGANLAEMCRLGVAVPPGFTLPSSLCAEVMAGRGDVIEKLLAEGVTFLEEKTGKKLGDAKNPLLVSVRSGARASMPGMMDTVLNIGLNDQVAASFAEATGNPRFVYDAYRRFLHMFADVVLDLTTIDEDAFEEMLEARKKKAGVLLDTELDAATLKALCVEYRDYIKARAKLPEAPRDQLVACVRAVFESWNTPRARSYRRINHIPDDWGTAANVQTMVFGDRSDRSATGVCFTRNPSTGHPRVFGEWLRNAQGEDVVAGIRTPSPIYAEDGPGSLETEMPNSFKELLEVCARLEDRFHDMQDVEFTIEEDELFILQTRNGKRTGRAAVRVAVDLVQEGRITKEGALEMVDPQAVNQVLHPSVAPDGRAAAKSAGRLLVTGLAASPGAAIGVLTLSADDAVNLAKAGKKVVLARPETSADDVHGMDASVAIVTARGGMTSHAAVVARGMGKPSVVGCMQLTVDLKARTVAAGNKVLKEGDEVTVDGSTGEVFIGSLPLEPAQVDETLRTLLSYADAKRRLGVRANADRPEDALKARELGAEGVGLCRTEHMFFDKDRIPHMQAMILAETPEARTKALAALLPMQRQDFLGIFKAMDGLPVTIRMLDPPLHEFLPRTDEEVNQVASALGVNADAVRRASRRHHEENPMLGHRGVRLAVTDEGLPRMQVRAMLEAAVAHEAAGGKTKLEIMVPLVAGPAELKWMRGVIEEEAEKVFKEKGAQVKYLVGTMIELPRAALLADQVAEHAAFFSFGTNDLTQTTYGLSRDDSGTFLPQYLEKGLLTYDPFESVDEEGVGALVELAVAKGRATRPDLHLGICGEHGGDPRSISFFDRVGLEYVSCSPYRVPVARLAAARAALAREKAKAPKS